MAKKEDQQTPPEPPKEGTKNVHGNLLSFFSQGAGFYKDGYCRSSPSDDSKNFSVAVTLTHAFLQSEYGDDPPYKGHRAGTRMCVDAYNFAQAIKEMGPDTGPKVHLEATDKRALEVVSMGDLRRYAVKDSEEKDARNAY